MVCCAMNAIGNSVHFKHQSFKCAPIRSIGSADNLQLFLHHLVKHTRPTKHNTVWLLCDNHESHISVEGLDYASENGVFMLSFTSH